MRSDSTSSGQNIRGNGVSRKVRGLQWRRWVAACLAATSLLGGVLVAAVPPAGAASRIVPTLGNGPSGNFWTVPAVPAGAADGQLLYYNMSFVLQLNNVVTWNVAYVSTDASGNKIVVTGTVAVPSEPWTGKGPRPVVDFAAGTQGMDQTCAPSRQLTGGFEYEDPNIQSAISAGYVVVITDYQWGGTTNTPATTYMVGLAEGHAVLDIAKAVLQLPPAAVTSKNPVVVWGYSQGGGAAAEAGEQWPTYAPSVHLVGVAAGGVPGNLVAVGSALDGSVGAGFLFQTILGFHSAYPSLPYASVMNSAGVSLMASLQTQCVATVLLDYQNQHLSQYMVGRLSEQQVVAEGNWIPELEANSPGLPGAHIAVPVFNYAGTQDQIIPPAVENSTYANLCATGTVVQSSTLATDHIFGEYLFQSQVLTFMADRFAGDVPVNSCTTNHSSL